MIKTFFLFQVKPILEDTKVPLTQHIALEKYLNQTDVKQPEFILRYLTYHKLYIRNIKVLKTTSITDERSNISL